MPIPSVIVPNLNENQESDESEEEENDTTMFNALFDSTNLNASTESNENEPNDQTNECNDEKPIFTHVILDDVTDAATSELFASTLHESQSNVDPLAISQNDSNNESVDSASSNIIRNNVSGASTNSKSTNKNGSNNGSQTIVDDQTEQNVQTVTNVNNMLDESTSVIATSTIEPEQQSTVANQILKTIAFDDSDDSLEYTYDPTNVLIPIQDKPEYRVKANDVLCGNIPFKPNVSILPLYILLY